MAFPTTNLFARYEAKDEVYNDLDPVTTVNDQSGNNRDMVGGPAALNPPEYRTAILNGHAVYRFDGANSEAALRAGLGITGATALTLSVVAAATSEGSSRRWPFGLYTTTTDIFGITEGETASEWGTFVRSTAGDAKENTSGVDTTAFCVLTLVWNGTTAELFRNGTSVSSTALGGTMDIAESGMGDIELSEFFSGDIALAAYWNTALDATARADLHTYVQDTYGISVSDYNGGGGGAGFAKLQGAPRVTSQGQHDGDGDVTLKDAPTMLAWTEKSGQGYALAFDADLGINRTQLEEAGEGFGLLRSYPTLIAFGQKGGESEVTGFGGPILLGQGEKSGEGFGLDRDASFLLALASKGGAGDGLGRGHPYLLSHGEKSVAGSAEGFALVFDHGRLLAEATKAGTSHGLTTLEARAVAHAMKATSGYGLSHELARALARSLKAGQGLAVMGDEAYLATLGQKAVDSRILLLDSPYLLADGTFQVVVLLPPNIVDVPPRVWVVDVD